MSISPFLVYDPPYLLLRLYHDEVIKESEASEDIKESDEIKESEEIKEAEEVKEKRETNSASASKSPKPQTPTLKTCTDKYFSAMDTIYREFGNRVIEEMDQLLDPMQHLYILVQTWFTCKATGSQCQPAGQHLLRFYSASDMTLGQFVEMLCLESSNICPAKGCERPMLSHVRTYCHARVSIAVELDELETPVPGMQDSILMWSTCRICNAVTPIVSMSEEGWMYSFAKFLELIIYNTDARCRQDICPHYVMRDHMLHFAFQHIVVKLYRRSIELREISTIQIRPRKRML